MFSLRNLKYSYRLFSIRNFKILGLQQIAIGGLDKALLKDFWTVKLGIPKVHDFKSEKENVDEDILKLGLGPSAVEIDIMSPLDPEKKPKVHDPPLNHVGLWVDDLKKCVEGLEAQGIKMAPGGIRKGAGGHDVTFIHPKFSCKVLVELVQAPQDVIDFYNSQQEQNSDIPEILEIRPCTD